ncbi:MAG: universal stress protein [Anaerolineae bacterium]
MKILLAVAGLPYGEPTLRLGGALTRALDAELTLLTVVPSGGDQAAAQDTLEAAGELLKDLNPVLQTASGPPSEAILRYAEEGGFDLLVIGAKERPSLPEFVLGTAAQRVVADAPCSTLVVKGSRDAVSRILVCTGGKPQGEVAVKMGATLARATGAAATLLHVTAPIPAMYTGLAEMEEHLDEFLRTDTPEARHLKQGAQILQDEEVPGEIEIRHGAVVEQILREARRGDYDLIVVGATARGALAGYLLGDVGRKILELAHRPVLVATRKTA